MIRLGTLTGILLMLASVDAVGAPQEKNTTKEQLRAIYVPWQVEHATLAQDGRHVAFAVRGEQGIEVRVFATEDATQKVVVWPDVGPTLRIHFLGWADAERLVVVTDAQIGVIDPVKGRLHRLGDESLFQRGAKAWRAEIKRRVVGLTAAPQPQLLVEVSVTADEVTTLELHRLDVTSGASERVFEAEVPVPGGSLITDRAGRVRIVFQRGTIPQEFSYYPAAGKSSGQNLDRLLSDGTTFGFRVTPENYLGARTIPLGFGADPNLLYFASNLGQDAYGLRAVDLTTQQGTPLLAEMPGVDLVDLNAPWIGSPLLFDRQDGTLAGVQFKGPGATTHWFDPEIAAGEKAVALDFPGRDVSVLEWDQARQRLLVLVATPGDPGRYFVHDRRTGYNTEYIANAPKLDPDLRNVAEPFAFAAPSGHVTGWLTWPRAPLKNPPPVMVWLHDGPLRRGPPQGSRDAQALATLGFAVLEVNYAGVAGEGRARREALRDGYDTVPVAEMVAALDWLATQRPFAQDQVAVAGEGFGSYLALRATQLRPDVFRAAVAVNSVTDLADFWKTEQQGNTDFSASAPTSRDGLPDLTAADEAQKAASAATRDRMVAAASDGPEDFDREFVRWLIRQGRPLSEVAVTPQANRLVRPVFLLPQRNNPRAPLAAASALRKTLRRLERPPRYLELTPSLTRAELMKEIADFLTDSLGDPAAKKGVAP